MSETAGAFVRTYLWGRFIGFHNDTEIVAALKSRDAAMRIAGIEEAARDTQRIANLVDYLARRYCNGESSEVARLCDEELDRSGELLGRVRQKAALDNPTK